MQENPVDNRWSFLYNAGGDYPFSVICTIRAEWKSKDVQRDLSAMPKEVIHVKKEVNPAVFWALIGVVAIVVVIGGFRMFSSSRNKADTTGSDETIKRVQETGKFYEPPPGAPVPGGGSTSGASAPSGYNLTPPTR